jgi:thiol oxidase
MAQARAYPCGLWQLFHTLLARAEDDEPHVLRAIQLYVAHFFGCSDCASHFGRLASSSDDPIPAATSPPSSPPGGVTGVGGAVAPRWRAHPPGVPALWLWRAHNAVNKRLNGSSERAVLTSGLRKLQWPTAQLCPECGDAERAGGTRWHEAAVLAFLRRSYCRHEPADDAGEGAACAAAP